MSTYSESAFDRVLRVYEQRIEDEQSTVKGLSPSEAKARRDEFLLPVGREAADLIRDLAVGLGAAIIVELGTSFGYSTLFLADAARRTGGRVYSYDVAGDKQDYASERLAEAGLLEFVEWRTGDALELLPEQPGPVDLVLLDIWKDLYVPCFDLIYPLLAPDGVVVADNMLEPERARLDAARYRAAVRARPDIEAILLPIGQGLDISKKRG